VLYIIGIGLSYLAQLGRKNASKTS